MLILGGHSCKRRISWAFISVRTNISWQPKNQADLEFETPEGYSLPHSLAFTICPTFPHTMPESDILGHIKRTILDEPGLCSGMTYEISVPRRHRWISMLAL
jgi:hypothetical protein